MRLQRASLDGGFERGVWSQAEQRALSRLAVLAIAFEHLEREAIARTGQFANVCHRYGYNSFTSRFRCLSRQRCTSFLQLGGAGNSFRFSVSTEPGQSRVLTCTNAKSVEPTPMLSQAPKEAAARTARAYKGGKQSRKVDRGQVMARRNMGKTGREIAEALGVSEASVWRNLAAAKKR